MVVDDNENYSDEFIYGKYLVMICYVIFMTIFSRFFPGIGSSTVAVYTNVNAHELLKQGQSAFYIVVMRCSSTWTFACKYEYQCAS